MVNKHNVKFELWWIIANIFGAGLGFALAYHVDKMLVTKELYNLSHSAFILIIGITIGLTQWLAILPYIKHHLLWIVVTAAGWSIGFYTHFELFKKFGFPILMFLNSPVFLPLLFAFISVLWGFIVGVLQWLILVFQFPYAYRWLRVNIWAVSVSFSVAGMGLYSAPPDSDAAFSESVVKSVLMGVLGLIYGFLTSGVLANILQNPKSQS